MKHLAKLAGALALLVALTSGCAVNRATASVDPSARLGDVKTVHVARTEKNDKDDGAVDLLIADNLRKRGLTVTTGPKPAGRPDAVVTYMDKWMWDITMYMLELTIVVREPQTDFPMATGNSYHTSLSRLTPAQMVDEVLGNIFNKKEARK